MKYGTLLRYGGYDWTIMLIRDDPAEERIWATTLTEDRRLIVGSPDHEIGNVFSWVNFGDSRWKVLDEPEA
jgi:hypothetical protein